MTTLRMFTIYDHPRDYPSGFMVREWEVGADGMTPGPAWHAPTLESARDLIPEGLVCLARHPTDDAVIVETWT